MLRHLSLILLLAGPSLAADKTLDTVMREVLRDLAGIEEQMKSLQTSLEVKLADMGQTNADRSRTAADQAAKSIATLGDRFQKTLQDQQDQQDKTLAAVAGLSSQLKTVSGELLSMREAVSDLTVTMSKLNSQMSELKTTVKDAVTPKLEATKPELSCSDMFTAAESDRRGGRFELAQTEYIEYVGKCAETDDAPNAQYYIGSIYYSNKVWEDAIKAFDLLAATFSDSKRVPEALWYKGDALLKLGRTLEAKPVFADLVKRFPAHPLAKQILSVK